MAGTGGRADEIIDQAVDDLMRSLTPEQVNKYNEQVSGVSSPDTCVSSPTPSELDLPVSEIDKMSAVDRAQLKQKLRAKLRQLESKRKKRPLNAFIAFRCKYHDL